jgi:hypothetical protein
VIKLLALALALPGAIGVSHIRTIGGSMNKKQLKGTPDKPNRSFSTAVKAMGNPKPKVDKVVKKYAKSVSKADRDAPPKIKK